MASFTAGETEACVSFVIVDNNLVEDSETFTITFDLPQGVILGNPATSTVTIIDNDGTQFTLMLNNAEFIPLSVGII